MNRYKVNKEAGELLGIKEIVTPTGLDDEIEKFLEKPNIELLDIKYSVDENNSSALIIYKEFFNEKR